MIRRPPVTTAARSSKARVRSGAPIALLVVAVLAITAPVSAQDARAEAAAKQALAQAQRHYGARHYNQALGVLKRAEKICEPDHCSSTMLAAVLRDIGTMQILLGDQEKGRANFGAALSFDPSIELNPAYATPNVQAIFGSVKNPGAQQQPSGDFDHTPPPEQKSNTPLPLYVEYHGHTHVSSVIVRYMGPTMTSYRRMPLNRVAEGWGGLIPCSFVTQGVVKYYFQGLDSEGLPVLDGGDRRHPYSVVIKPSISGPAPHLPGERAPRTCGGSSEGGGKPDGAECEMGDECASGRCRNDHCFTAESAGGGGGGGEGGGEEPVKPAGPSGGFARVWIGVSGAVDFTVVPSGLDVCKRNSDATGTQTDPNWACTTDTVEGIAPPGSNFPLNGPENDSLASGKAGNVESGLEPANFRVKATIDFAVTQNLLIGAAIGYVAGTYPGSVAPHFIPLHLEARGTWVFGDNPLSRPGFSPFIQLAAGVGEYDSNITVTVQENGVAGARPVQAWHVGGPAFVAVGAGLRYTFSPRVGLLLSGRFTAAFGSAFFPAFGPEVGLVFGL